MSATTEQPKEMKALHCIAVEQLPEVKGGASVFLAGSIEMGKARLWQPAMFDSLADLPITVFNPRRTDWNKEWKQDASHAKFKEQVDWELDNLERCDVIALFLQAGTMSPISLLELGIHASSGKLVVCCEPGFHRRGNVQIVCGRNNIPMYDTIEELTAEVRTRLVRILQEKNYKL